MDLVRPFAGTLFRAYQGLEQVPELSPNAITRQARLGVDFCLSMMKLNNLQQYRTVRYLPLADGGYGALHITVLPGYGGQPMVRAELEVSRQWIEEEEEENNREGLFIINNRWLLEPDPAVTPSGSLVGQVGDWRLFDTGGTVFKPGKQYNGFCTQSTDGKTQHAVWVYENEKGKKWIAENGALPFIKPVPGNGPLQEVPTQAAEAAGGCWFWYANDKLMGSFNTLTATEHPERAGNPLHLLEKTANSWSFYDIEVLDIDGYGQEYMWTPGLNRSDMTLDGTRIIWRTEQSYFDYWEGDNENFDISFVDKTATYLKTTDYNIPATLGLRDRENLEIITDTVVSQDEVDTRFNVGYFTKRDEIAEYWVYTGSFDYVINSSASESPIRYFTEYRTQNYTWHTGIYEAEQTFFPDKWGWVNNVWTQGLWLYAELEPAWSEGTQTLNQTLTQVFSSELGVRVYWQDNDSRVYSKSGTQHNYDQRHIAFAGNEKFYEKVFDEGYAEYTGEIPQLPIISTTTLDFCGLFLLIPSDGYTGDLFPQQVQLFGVAQGKPVDLNGLLADNAEFKQYIIELAEWHVGYLEDAPYNDRSQDTIPIPATRGCAFSAAG